MADEKHTSIDTYIGGFPKETQSVLEKARQVVRDVAPDATETISYGILAFKLNGRSFMYISGWRHHISVHPVPVGGEAFQKEIAPYVHGKGTLQFPLDKPIPYDVIRKAAEHLKRVVTG